MNVIAHNLSAMNTNRQLNISTKNKEKAVEKLSSGYCINKAADDAAGLTISEKMRSQIRGLSQGIENTEAGVSLCQVADGALAEVTDMLHRITELSVQSANGTNTAEDRDAIQKEISQILQEIDRIGETTTFNEQKIFRGITNNNAIVPISPISPSTPTVKDFPINQVSMTPLRINNTNMNSFLTDNITFTVKTDDDGLWVDSSDGVSFAKMSWDDFGITNTDVTQSKTYTYTDRNTGLKISFDLKSGASRNEIRTAIDGTIIKGDISIDTSKASSYMNLTTGCQYLTSANSEVINLTYIDLREMGCTFDRQWMTTSQLVYKNNFYDNQKSPMGDTNSTIKCTFGNLTIGEPLEAARNSLWSQACGYAVDDSSAYSNKSIIMLNDDMSGFAPGLASTYIMLSFMFDFTGISNGKNAATLTDSEKIGFNEFATAVFDELGKQSLTIGYFGDALLECTDTILTGYFEQDASALNPVGPSQDSEEKSGSWIQSAGIWIQLGCSVGDGMFLEIDPMNTSILGINDLDASTVDGAYHAMEAVEGALEKVSANRSKIGAQQNRLEHTIANEENVVENTTAAESRIRDTDMAREMVKFSKENILENFGQAMLAQANQMNQNILSLLE